MVAKIWGWGEGGRGEAHRPPIITSLNVHSFSLNRKSVQWWCNSSSLPLYNRLLNLYPFTCILLSTATITLTHALIENLSCKCWLYLGRFIFKGMHDLIKVLTRGSWRRGATTPSPTVKQGGALFSYFQELLVLHFSKNS